MKLISNDSVSLFANGKITKIESSDSRFKEAYKLLAEKGDEKGFLKLAATKPVVAAIKSIQKETRKRTFKIRNGRVFFGTHEIRGRLATKVEKMLKEGLSLAPFVKYCERGLKNPNRESFEALYDWDEEAAITDEGMFIGYKYVRDNYYSIHGNTKIKPIKGKVNDEGQIYNGVGEEIVLRREDVEAGREECAHRGLHVGNRSYVQRGGNYRNLLIEVDPADVVTVPIKQNCKIRVCRYKVVGEFQNEINEPVVSVDRKVNKVVKVKAKDSGVKSRNQKIKDYVSKNAISGGILALRSIANSISPDYIKIAELRGVLKRQGWTVEGNYVIL